MEREEASAAPKVRYEFGRDDVLLSALCADSRVSFEDLAARTGTSRQSAWRRVRSLMGSIIWGFTAVVDHRALGWRHYVLSVPGAPEARLMAAIQATCQTTRGWGSVRVLQAVLTRGDAWRCVLQVAAHDALVMEAFLQTLRANLPAGVPVAVEEVEHVFFDSGFEKPKTGPEPKLAEEPMAGAT